MIRYKIFKSKDHLKCRRFENGFKETIDSEVEMRAILNEILCDDYKMIINGDNLVIKTKDKKVVIEDYKNNLARNLISSLSSKFKSGHLPDSFCRKVDPKLYNRPTKKSSLKGIIRQGALAFISVTIIAAIFGSTMSAFDSDVINEEPLAFSEARSVSEEIIEEETNIEEIEEEIRKEAIEEEIRKAAIEEEKEKEERLYKEKIIDFIYKEQISIEQFNEYLTLLVDGNNPFNLGFKNEGEAFLNVCFKSELSYPEKFLMIMLKGGYTYEELDFVCAGCLAEAAGAGTCYDDAYAVASTLLNRTHNSWYYNNYGAHFYNQIMAPNQYTVVTGNVIYDFMGRIDLEGYHAAIDALYSGEPMHDYLEFRGHWVDVKAPHEEFAPNGNKYMVKLKSEDYVDYEEEVSKEEVRKRVLTLDNIIPEV